MVDSLQREKRKITDQFENQVFQLKEQILQLQISKEEISKEMKFLKESKKNQDAQNEEDLATLKEKNQYLESQLIIVKSELDEMEKETQNMIQLYENKINDQKVQFNQEKENWQQKVLYIQ